MLPRNKHKQNPKKQQWWPFLSPRRLAIAVVMVAQFLLKSNLGAIGPLSAGTNPSGDFHTTPGKKIMNNAYICSSLTSSLASTWKELTPAILKASYWPKKHSSNANFTNWINDLFLNYYGFHQLRRSSLYPADPFAAKELLKIISNRLKYLNNETTSMNPPLHILVSGGSVTLGNNCESNPVGIPARGEHTGNPSCAWPVRLENLFNEALFGNKSVVKVSNIAGGGASSEIGKVVLDYQLFPEEVRKESPHVVIWAHAPNDAGQPDRDRTFYEHLPGFVHAARNLDKCNDDLPMVVVLEDFYGSGTYESVNQMSGYLSELSSWYGLMSVNHANVIKHELWANFDIPYTISHILGSNYHIHTGMGSHAGVAWTMFFNFLSAFIDSCTAESLGLDIPVSSIPLKFMGPYDTSGSYDAISPTWRRNKDEAREYCSKQPFLNKTTEPCTYAFMANSMSGVNSVKGLRAVMKGVLMSSDGWEASGNPVKQPRIGWYASKEGAKFSLEIVVSSDTKFLTIMSMKSYGPKFVDTMLEINIQINRKDTDQHATSTHQITGYHETKTSIHVPHKFELPGGGAQVGDVILLDAILKRGAYFKINGIAFCAY